MTRYISAETREKIGEASRKRWSDPEYKARVGRKISKAKIGHAASDETKRKQSEAHKECVISEETRLKIREAVRIVWVRGDYTSRVIVSKPGRLYQDYNWFYNHYVELSMTMTHMAELCGCSSGIMWYWRRRHGIELRSGCSDETKAKISAALSGRKGKKRGPPSAATREKISKSNTGKKHSAEARKKMSDSARCRVGGGMTGKHFSEETKKKMRAAALGQKPSEETKKKMSEIRSTPEFRKNHSEKMKAAHARGVYKNPVVLEKKSKAMKAAHANGSFSHGILRPTSLEKLAYSACDLLGLSYKKEYRIPGNGRPFDLYLVDYNLLVEMQGTYWHTRKGAVERDISKRLLAWDSGYKYAEIWEHELNKLYPELIISKVVGGVW